MTTQTKPDQCTFRDFVSQEYHASSVLAQYYGDFESYFLNYLNNNSFEEWQNTFRNTDIPLALVNDIAYSMVEYGSRDIAEIPSILALMMRTKNCEIPVIEGILTPEYWKAWFKMEKSLTH